MTTPLVYAGDLGIKLLHVDLNQGLWVLRNRFSGPRGADPLPHRSCLRPDAGGVGLRRIPGLPEHLWLYLYEPAHSVHTLTVPETNDGETDVWFAIHEPTSTLTNTDRSPV